VCDDSPLRRSAAGRVREPHERLRADELIDFGNGSAGIVTFPDGLDEPAPLVVVAPERYGLVQHTVDVATRFSAHGWVTISPDFYIGVGDDNTERLPPVSDDVVLRHVSAAVEYVARDSRADAARIGFYGVCRSGSWGVLAASRLPAVRAVIMLYGGAGQREWAVSADRAVAYADMIAASTAPALGIFGERDHTMSVADVTQLRDAFEAHNRSYDISIVPDMPHGWINDTMPGRYRAEPAEQVWTQMTGFLRRHLDQDPQPGLEWSFRAGIGADYDFAANTRLA
jgi:carboxymethylenebutenolidase